MSRARELAKAGGLQQTLAGVSSHVGVSTFAENVVMYQDLSVSGDLNVTGDLTYDSTAAENAFFSGITTAVNLISTGVQVSGMMTIGAGASTTAMVVDGNLLPSSNNVHDLGSPTRVWRDVYIGPGSLYVNGQKVLQEDSSNIVVSCDENQNLVLQTSGSGDIEIDPTGTGIVQVKGTLQIQDGDNITNSAGNNVAFGNNVSVDQIVSRSNNTNLTLSGNGSGVVRVNDDLTVTGALDVQGGSLTIGNNGVDVTTITASGVATATGGFVGDVTGNVTGDVTGNINASGITTLGMARATSLYVGAGVTIQGDLVVNGTTTTINSTTLSVDDKNITLADTDSPTDAAADGGGITLKGNSDKTITYDDTNTSWDFSESVNLASTSEEFKIADASVLSSTTLGSNVVNSSLTSVGTIASGTWQGTAIANAYLANSSVSLGGVSVSLGGSDATPAFDLTDATNYPASSLTGTVANSQLAGDIPNSKLENTSVSFGGVSVDLGDSDATPAFDLSDATGYPAARLTGTVANSGLSNSSVNFGGVSVSLGGGDATPAFNLSDATNLPTTALTGTITNAQLAGSISNDKMASATVSYGGIELNLGESDPTPAFNLSDATGYPITSLDSIDSNAAAWLASPTSANFETALGQSGAGSGSFVRSVSGILTTATLVTPTISGQATGADLTLTGGLQVGAAVTITGDLTVNGTTTTLNSTVVSIDDKTFELGSVDTPTDTTANAGGIVLKGATDHTLLWYNDNDHWESSENFNLVSGKTYQIADTAVLSATTLGSGVINSSLTSVGTLGVLDVTGNISVGGTINGVDIVGLQTAVDNSVRFFASTESPTAAVEGDLWRDTDTDQFYIASGIGTGIQWFQI